MLPFPLFVFTATGSPLMKIIVFTLATVISCFVCGPIQGQNSAYNPYADSQDSLPPIAADGTIQWGTFYKSSALQKSYERLWNQGACRGTNKAITIPVEQNKLDVNKIPESQYTGTVRGTAGGAMAISDSHEKTLVVLFHPAGVTSLSITGKVPADILRTGMIVRVLAQVAHNGKGSEPIRTLDIVTPSKTFKPDPVEADRLGSIVGVVTQFKNGVLLLRVNSGTIRRISLSVASDAVANIEAADLALVSPGDSVTVKGRLWAGEGSTADGTLFASTVVVTKPVLEKSGNILPQKVSTAKKLSKSVVAEISAATID